MDPVASIQCVPASSLRSRRMFMKVLGWIAISFAASGSRTHSGEIVIGPGQRSPINRSIPPSPGSIRGITNAGGFRSPVAEDCRLSGGVEATGL